MSLSSSRAGYTHICTVERDANLETSDAWGGQKTPEWKNHLTELPCRAWTNAAREPVDEEKTATYEDRRLSVELETDVTEADRIASVTDKNGNTVFAGPMNIEGVLNYPDHMELILEHIRG